MSSNQPPSAIAHLQGITRTEKPTEMERRVELLKRLVYRSGMNPHLLAAGLAAGVARSGDGREW